MSPFREIAEEEQGELLGLFVLASIYAPVEEMEARIGVTPHEHAQEEWGDCWLYPARLDGGVVFALIRVAEAPEPTWTVLGHTIRDLDAILRALEVPPRHVLWRQERDPDRPWRVIRVDGAGQRAPVMDFETEEQARHSLEHFARRADGCTYVVERRI